MVMIMNKFVLTIIDYFRRNLPFMSLNSSINWALFIIIALQAIISLKATINLAKLKVVITRSYRYYLD
jgi:hypothetical protein